MVAGRYSDAVKCMNKIRVACCSWCIITSSHERLIFRSKTHPLAHRIQQHEQVALAELGGGRGRQMVHSHACGSFFGIDGQDQPAGRGNARIVVKGSLVSSL